MRQTLDTYMYEFQWFSIKSILQEFSQSSWDNYPLKNLQNQNPTPNNLAYRKYKK